MQQKIYEGTDVVKTAPTQDQNDYRRLAWTTRRRLFALSRLAGFRTILRHFGTFARSLKLTRRDHRTQSQTRKHSDSANLRQDDILNVVEIPISCQN